ncbi:MAG: phage portal protein [Mogibacterium sp.]|nr:phage portal protein [Mogibacterium sp.]
MGLFDWLKPKNDTRVSSLPGISDSAAWASYFSQHSGMGPEEALRVAAVFRCVDLVSKTMATLPLHLYRITPEGKQKERVNPLFPLLYVQPNPYTTAYELMQMLVVNILLTRGGFLRLKRNGRGQITALYNIPTAVVSGPFENSISGERYINILDGRDVVDTLYEGEYLYVSGFRFDDVNNPEDPMQIAAEVLGLNRDMQTFAQKGFTGANPGGFIEHPQSMSDRAFERFKKEFQENYAGVQNAGRWLILEEGMKAQPWNRNMEQSQLLESRKWAISEICRIFGVPPHLCMDMEHATFSNIEQQSMEFVRDCINPLCVRLEQVFYRDLLSTKEKRDLYFKFNLNGLMRGDTAARTNYYHIGRQDGWLSTDDIRELEDMNRLPEGAGGDIYAVNGNMIPLAAVPFNLPKGAQVNNG